MITRKSKGQDIATRLHIEHQGALWQVPSASGRGVYTVDVDSTPPRCSCPDYELSGFSGLQLRQRVRPHSPWRYVDYRGDVLLGP